MSSKSRLGIGSVLLVAILALVLGGASGALVARNFASTKIVRQTVSGSSIPASASTTSSTPMSWAEVARRAGPAVVTIINEQAPVQSFFGTQAGARAEGSGFVIDRRGYILTNNHVVENEQTLTVVFADGRKAPATLIHTDRSNDLAVIRVHVKVNPVLHFGDSNTLSPGEPVLAIGSALGEFRNTVTSGVVSALNRTITEPNNVALHGMLQTDAAINEGNSGGPLLDSKGEVVGINTAVNRGAQQSNAFGLQSSSVVAEGLGFAIPSSTAQNVAQRLIQNKPTAFLGVVYTQLDQQNARFYGFPVGAYVREVKVGSPADKAHLQQRDIITKIDGQPLTDTHQLEQVISGHKPGDTTTISVWRNGKTLNIKVKLGANTQ